MSDPFLGSSAAKRGVKVEESAVVVDNGGAWVGSADGGLGLGVEERDEVIRSGCFGKLGEKGEKGRVEKGE